MTVPGRFTPVVRLAVDRLHVLGLQQLDRGSLALARLFAAVA